MPGTVPKSCSGLLPRRTVKGLVRPAGRRPRTRPLYCSDGLHAQGLGCRKSEAAPASLPRGEQLPSLARGGGEWLSLQRPKPELADVASASGRHRRERLTPRKTDTIITPSGYHMGLMIMATARARTRRVNIRVSDDLADRLEQVALSLGMAQSTVGAMAIAEYVRKKDLENRMASEAMTSIIKHQEQQLDSLMQEYKDHPEKLAEVANKLRSEEQSELPLT